MAAHPLDRLEFRDAAEAIHHYAASKPRTKRAGQWPHGLEKPGWELLARDLGGHPLACRLAGELCAAHTLDPAALHDQLVGQGLHPLLPGEKDGEKQNSKKNLQVLFRQSALAVQTLSPGTDSSPSPALTAWRASVTRVMPQIFMKKGSGVICRGQFETLTELSNWPRHMTPDPISTP